MAYGIVPFLIILNDFRDFYLLEVFKSAIFLCCAAVERFEQINTWCSSCAIAEFLGSNLATGI